MNERALRELEVHLVGVGLGHALTPPVYRFVARSINIPWKICSTECASIGEAVAVMRSAKLGGGVVTMPWKKDIMKHLDRLDDKAEKIQACNVVYFGQNNELVGSNTDWEGIEGAIKEKLKTSNKDISPKRALLIGAGGVSRAALYALTQRFGIDYVYVANRDDSEVEQLVADCKPMGAFLHHVKSVSQAQDLPTPEFIIGTVPDYEAVMPAEIEVKKIMESFLSREEKGFMLDMCYHPTRVTRNLKLAESNGWVTVQGTEVVGHQVEAIWRYWVTAERLKQLDRDGMWKCLREIADAKP